MRHLLYSIDCSMACPKRPKKANPAVRRGCPGQFERFVFRRRVNQKSRVFQLLIVSDMLLRRVLHYVYIGHSGSACSPESEPWSCDPDIQIGFFIFMDSFKQLQHKPSTDNHCDLLWQFTHSLSCGSEELARCDDFRSDLVRPILYHLPYDAPRCASKNRYGK